MSYEAAALHDTAVYEPIPADVELYPSPRKRPDECLYAVAVALIMATAAGLMMVSGALTLNAIGRRTADVNAVAGPERSTTTRPVLRSFSLERVPEPVSAPWSIGPADRPPAAAPTTRVTLVVDVCHPAYVPCLPRRSGDALDCADLDSDRKPTALVESTVDPYLLDPDGNGIGCEAG